MFTPNAMQAEILAEDPLRYLISAGTGGGKTALALLLAEGRILVVSPKTNRIDQNFKRDAALIGMEPPLHISKEDFVKNEPPACDTLILDECFVAGTKVQTPDGEKNIESLNIGDNVYNAIGIGKVTKLFNHETNNIIVLKLSNGQKLTVTQNHPFYTSNRGWVNASELDNSDRLFTSDMVLSNYGNKTFVRELWKADRAWLASRETVGSIQKELFDRVPHSFTGEEAKGFFSKQKRESSLQTIADWAFKKTEEKSQYEQSRNKNKSIKHTEKNRAQTSNSRRKWEINVSTTKNVIRSSWERMVRRICGDNRKGFFTESLQNRYCQSKQDDCGRSGWVFAQFAQSATVRQKKDSQAEEVGVESIEIQKQTNIRVFNISVSGHPSYIAGGVLVHNCEWAFGVEPNTYSRNGFVYIKTSKIHDAVFQYIQKYQPKRIYLLSATPCEKRMQAWAAARLLGVLQKPDFESFVAFREFTHKPRPRGYSILWLEKKTKKSQEAVRAFLRSFGYFKEMDKAEPNIINVPIELTDAQLEKIRATGEKYPEKKTEINGVVDRNAIDENSAVRNIIKYGIECGVFTEYVFDDEKHTQKRISTEISTNYLFELHKIVLKEQNPIIFAQYIKQIDIIKRYLEKHTDLNIVVITGSIKEAERAKALHAIGNIPNTVLIAQSSISAGWQTLISSATIFASVTRWRHYQQGIGRNSRYQNRHEVKNVYRLYLGPQSQHIWEDLIDHRKDFNDSLQSI